MLNNLLNKKFLMILPVATALVVNGCKEDAMAKTTIPEPVDLTQTEDLFSAPVKANPLTTDPAAVVVRVNGEDITRGEISKLMEMAKKQMAGRVAPQQMEKVQAQMYDQIKNDLITKKLIDAAVAKANITTDEAELAKAIEEIKQRIPAGKTLEEALSAQGITIEELNKNITDDLKTRKFLESKTQDITAATDAEAQEFYDTNPDQFKKPESASANHVLIKFAEGDTDEIKAKKKADLEKIRADIIAGTITFEDAAKQHSECPSGAQGGSLGTFGKGKMVPEFEVAAFTQEIDEVGDVFETQFGYHIVKVTARAEAGTVAFEETKDQITAYLSGQKKQKAVAAFIKTLRDSATIEEITM